MKTSQKIKIFIVDDHPLIRQALEMSILTEEDMDVVGTAADGAEAIELIPAIQPNIVIMDLMMPKIDGIEAITVLSKLCPEIHILALSSLEKEIAVFSAVQAGAQGYLTKNAQHEELIEAIRVLKAGKSYLPPEIMGKLMDGMREDMLNTKLVLSLTKRETEMLTLMGKGYSNAKISKQMMIAESTVRVYLHQIMKKMGFENRREAVVFAVKVEENRKT